MVKELLRPATPEDAVALLAKHKGKARKGQDAVVPYQ